MEFKFLSWRERHCQSFDKSKITLKKANVEYNVYDKIQEAREDTEIEPTLKKYGCIPEKLLNAQGVYDDFTQYADLRGIQDQAIKAKEMFYNLPLETRQKFNNNINTFVKEGKAYVEKIIEEERKLKTPVEVTPAQPVGEVNNG